VVDGAALEKRCAKAPRVRIPPSPPQTRTSDRWPRGAQPRAVVGGGPVSRSGCRYSVPRERSPSGLWRRTGNAVRGNPSRVRIPPSPPSTRAGGTPGRALPAPVLAHGRPSPLAPVLAAAFARPPRRRADVTTPPGWRSFRIGRNARACVGCSGPRSRASEGAPRASRCSLLRLPVPDGPGRSIRARLVLPC
jgi:hypothetical protein